MQHGADLEPREHLDEAGDVILVWMAEDEQVDTTCEEGQVLAHAAQRELWVWTAIHEHRRAAGGLHEDRVALPDVHDRHVQPAVGQPREGDGEEDGAEP
ncbi:MAG TPA: hypothetical protein VMP86_01045, partial [Candidatus Binatia bacterium]|nr:hypothetical protein [Candidatus Binatia bacterium]